MDFILFHFVFFAFTIFQTLSGLQNTSSKGGLISESISIPSKNVPTPYPEHLKRIVAKYLIIYDGPSFLNPRCTCITVSLCRDCFLKVIGQFDLPTLHPIPKALTILCQFSFECRMDLISRVLCLIEDAKLDTASKP